MALLFGVVYRPLFGGGLCGEIGPRVFGLRAGLSGLSALCLGAPLWSAVFCEVFVVFVLC